MSIELKGAAFEGEDSRFGNEEGRPFRAALARLNAGYFPLFI
jgi:hypothetical protein